MSYLATSQSRQYSLPPTMPLPHYTGRRSRKNVPQGDMGRGGGALNFNWGDQAEEAGIPFDLPGLSDCGLIRPK